MESNNISIKDSLEYIDGELIDIFDLDLDNLKIDKKNGKIFIIHYIYYINENKKPINQLYLSTKDVPGYILKNNDGKFLITD